MNSSMHEQFIAFCTVPLDQLSDEEWALLQVHMAYCPTCRQGFEESQRLAEAQAVRQVNEEGERKLSQNSANHTPHESQHHPHTFDDVEGSSRNGPIR